MEFQFSEEAGHLTSAEIRAISNGIKLVVANVMERHIGRKTEDLATTLQELTGLLTSFKFSLVRNEDGRESIVIDYLYRDL